MKKIGPAVCLVLILLVCASCGGIQKTVFEMELSENYSDSEPFIHEKLFCVSEDTDTLELNFTFQMEGKSGLLEIADNQTKEVLWSRNWDGNTDKTNFEVFLQEVKEEKEFVVRFTGTGIQYADIVVASGNSLVRERERPQKRSNKE